MISSILLKLIHQPSFVLALSPLFINKRKSIQLGLHSKNCPFTHDLISCHNITIYFNYKQWLFLWQMFAIAWNFLNFFEKSCFPGKSSLFLWNQKKGKEKKGKNCFEAYVLKLIGGHWVNYEILLGTNCSLVGLQLAHDWKHNDVDFLSTRVRMEKRVWVCYQE